MRMSISPTTADYPQAVRSVAPSRARCSMIRARSMTRSSSSSVVTRANAKSRPTAPKEICAPFLVLQLLKEKHLGDELDGTVTGIMPNGTIFVSIDRYLVDGAIKSRDMKGDAGARRLTEDDKHFVPRPRDGGKGRTGRDKFGNKSGFKKGRRGRKG